MPLAEAVAYSQVRTCVHHRSDVLLGSAIGAAFGLAAAMRLSGAGRAGPARRTRSLLLLAQAVLVTSTRVAGGRDLAAARGEMRRRGLTITAELDVGKAGSVPDLLMAGGPALVIAAGGDGTVGTVSFARIATRGAVRDRLGRFSYPLAAAYAMRNRPAFRCELSYAGTTETVTLT
jgi:diacylglycerol kinase family enzyme